MIGFLLLSKEFVDGDRSQCYDCQEFSGMTKLISFGIFSGKYGYAFIEGRRRVYVPPDAYAIVMNAAIHKSYIFIDTITEEYCINP